MGWEKLSPWGHSLLYSDLASGRDHAKCPIMSTSYLSFKDIIMTSYQLDKIITLVLANEM